jgi:hypothetical protein
MVDKWWTVLMNLIIGGNLVDRKISFYDDAI